ncbi:MAG: hypothetical protein ACOZQL_20005 [Myxococcota bacterium]
MHRSPRPPLAVALLGALIASTAFAGPPYLKLKRETSKVKPQLTYSLSDLQKLGKYSPLDAVRAPAFVEENVGQSSSPFPFIMRSTGFSAGFFEGGLTAAVFRQPGSDERSTTKVAGTAIGLDFVGSTTGKLTGFDALTGSVRVASGKNAASWKATIPSFSGLAYEALYPGIQLLTHARDGRLAYAFRLEPSAQLSTIRVAVRGVKGLSLGAKGELLMNTGSGVIVQTAPRFFEETSAGRREISGQFVLLGPTEYGFVAPSRAFGSRLAVDPEIVFTSYFGGSRDDGSLARDTGADNLHGQGFDIAVGAGNDLFVAGTTVSVDFPVSAAGSVIGGSDAFVMRLDLSAAPGQQVVYATFFGGTGFERGVSVAAQSDGTAFVVGCTTSSDFPVTAGVVEPLRQNSVGYLARFGPSGVVEASTLLGHSTDHHPASVVLSRAQGEASEFVYVGGSVQRPLASNVSDAKPGAFQAQYAGGTFDGFVAKLDLALTRYEYFTYLGGARQDLVMDLAVNEGFAFVTGSTTSFDFPTTELVFQPRHSQAATGNLCDSPATARQCFDAFATRLGRTGGSLIYSTFMGGEAEEYGRGIAAPNNQATITGAERPVSGTATKLFTTRLESSAENRLFRTLLDGVGVDHGEELVVDPLGRTHVVGTIGVNGRSTTDTSFHGGAGDVFYARHAAQTGALEYFTYLGGSGHDRGYAIATQGTTEENFCAYLAGATNSDDLQTVAALEAGEEHQGGADLLLMAVCDLRPSFGSGGFSKTVSPAAALPNETFRYTIIVENGGDVPANVTVTDVVPSSVTVTGVSGPGCGINGNTVTCNFAAQPGGNVILISARAGACGRTVLNTATLRVGAETFTSSASSFISCPAPRCGNGTVDPGEQCDSTAGCRSNCTLSRCGDGVVDPGEQCDAPGSARCSSSCTNVRVAGDACSASGAECSGALVCGRRCSATPCANWFECLFGEEVVELCTTPATCMPAGEASRVVGQ